MDYVQRVVGKLHMSAERLSISCRSWRRSGDWGHGPQCSYLLMSSRSYRNIGRRDSIWRSVPALFVTTVLGRSWANVTREVFCGLVFLLYNTIQYNTKFVKRHVAVASEALALDLSRLFLPVSPRYIHWEWFLSVRPSLADTGYVT